MTLIVCLIVITLLVVALSVALVPPRMPRRGGTLDLTSRDARRALRRRRDAS